MEYLSKHTCKYTHPSGLPSSQSWCHVEHLIFFFVCIYMWCTFSKCLISHGALWYSAISLFIHLPIFFLFTLIMHHPYHISNLLAIELIEEHSIHTEVQLNCQNNFSCQKHYFNFPKVDNGYMIWPKTILSHKYVHLQQYPDFDCKTLSSSPDLHKYDPCLKDILLTFVCLTSQDDEVFPAVPTSHSSHLCIIIY